jgi:hypothetical protein
MELKDRSLTRYTAVVGGALGLSLVVYLVVGVSGYLSFGDAVSGDVLENFADDYWMAAGARVALVCIMMSVFPKTHHAVRDGLILLRWDGKYSTETLPYKDLFNVTGAVIFASTAAAVLLTKIEAVLAYKGAALGSFLVYIIPSLMYVALCRSGHGSSRGPSFADSRGPSFADSSRGPSFAKLDDETDDDDCSETPFVLLPEDDDSVHYGTAPESFSDDSKPQRVWPVLLHMLKTKRFWWCSLMVVWGCGSGVLGVTVTALAQFDGDGRRRLWGL